MDYDNVEFLDAYDRMVGANLFELVARAFARQKPVEFMEIFNSLTRDKEVAERLSGELHSAVDAHIIQGELINAIKQYRSETGAGLRESKDWVDARCKELRARGKLVKVGNY